MTVANNKPMKEVENHRIQRIVSKVPTDSSVLDIGGARELYNGESLHRQLAKRANNCVWIDINQETIEEFEDYDIRFVNAESFDLDESFDVAVAGELIEHLDNPGLMLDQVYDHLNVNRKVILTTPYPWTFLRIRQAVFGKRKPA